MKIFTKLLHIVQAVAQGQFLRGVQFVSIQSFSSGQAKKPCLSYNLSIAPRKR